VPCCPRRRAISSPALRRFRRSGTADRPSPVQAAAPAVAAENRCHPAGADQQGADPRDEGETIVRLDPFAQPVGRAGETARPESVLVELFDRRRSAGVCGPERKGKIRHRIAIEQYTGALEHDPKTMQLLGIMLSEAALSSCVIISGPGALTFSPAQGCSALDIGDEIRRLL